VRSGTSRFKTTGYCTRHPKPTNKMSAMLKYLLVVIVTLYMVGLALANNATEASTNTSASSAGSNPTTAATNNTAGDENNGASYLCYNFLPLVIAVCVMLSRH